MMLLRLLVVFVALFEMVSAKLTPEQEVLYIKKADLESKVLEYKWWWSAEKVMETVVDLQENYYTKLPHVEHPTSADRWVRDIMDTIYATGKVSKENCESIDLYNKTVDAMIKRCAKLNNVVKTLKHYQHKQQKMC